MDHWSETHLQQLYDGVLLRSALEFQEALHVLGEGHRSWWSRETRDSAHIREIRRGLRAMLRELERRGLFLPEVGRPAMT